MLWAQAEPIFCQRLLHAREPHLDTVVAGDRLNDEAKHAVAESEQMAREPVKRVAVAEANARVGTAKTIGVGNDVGNASSRNCLEQLGPVRLPYDRQCLH